VTLRHLQALFKSLRSNPLPMLVQRNEIKKDGDVNFIYITVYTFQSLLLFHFPFGFGNNHAP